MSERHTFVTAFAYDDEALSELMTTLRRNRVGAHMLCPEASPSARYVAGFFRDHAPGVTSALVTFEQALTGLDHDKMPIDGWLVVLATDSGPAAVMLTREGLELTWPATAQETAA